MRRTIGAILLITALVLTAGVASADSGHEGEPEHPAAPAVAARLLDEAGIPHRYVQGRSGGNHVADVAREMGSHQQDTKGTDFWGICKSNEFEYSYAIAHYLNTKPHPAAVEYPDSAAPGEFCVSLWSNPVFKSVPGDDEEIGGHVCFHPDSVTGELWIGVGLSEGRLDTEYGIYLEYYSDDSGDPDTWLDWYKMGTATTNGSGEFGFTHTMDLDPGTYYLQVIVSYPDGTWGEDSWGTNVYEVVIYSV